MWTLYWSLMVGSHDRRSLQLFPKMYYYASPTLRSETTLPLKDHSTYVKITTPCNRWFFFSIDPVPSCHYILFSLTTPRRVWNFCDSVKRIENRAEKLHTYATFWSHLCQKLAYYKKSRARKISRVVPRERRDCSICSLHSKNYVTFTLTTRNRVANFCDKHPTSKSCKLLFGWCRCLRACRLITMEWNVKRIVPCKRWENFLSGTYLCVLTCILNTLHGDAYRHDDVVKFQTRLQKLHTSATFCRHVPWRIARKCLCG